MLRVISQPGSAYPRLFLDGVRVKAWIEHSPSLCGSADWTLWYEHQGRLARGKCQLRLEIEGKLRSWLLRQCGVPLGTLTYEELRLVAEGKIHEALRLHAHGIDALMPYRAPPTIPHVSAA